MRILTDEQVERTQQQLDKIPVTIHYCSAIKGDSDYKYIGTCLVHRKELQEVMYRECGDFFEVFYRGQYRAAFKKDFTIHN